MKQTFREMEDLVTSLRALTGWASTDTVDQVENKLLNSIAAMFVERDRLENDLLEEKESYIQCAVDAAKVDEELLIAQKELDKLTQDLPTPHPNSAVSQYFSQTKKILDSINTEDVENLIRSLKDLRACEGRLFVVGVGGSAANASHLCNDFRKMLGIEAYTPTDNVSELTARINDQSWADCFSEYLKGSKMNSDDALLVLSVGGGSPTTSQNIVKAVEYANSVGSRIFGIVSRDGGTTRDFAEPCILIPPLHTNRITPHAEEIQAVIWHLITTIIAEDDKDE